MKIPSNKIRDILNYFRTTLSGIYEPAEIERLAEICFEEFTGLKRKDLILDEQKTVNESDLLRFNFAVKDLKKGRPIQYIIGKSWFYGFTFKVNPDVLIPRPETEELVDKVIAFSASHPESFSILDIGTGSGCIAVTLKKKISRSHVYALDVSAEALKTAAENAEINNADIHFIQASILDESDFDKLPAVSVIVSNPPYVKQSEKSSMNVNVTEHEPHLALFVPDDDALVFYRAIAKLGKKKLKPGGKIFTEINEKLGIETCLVFQQEGFTDVELITDLQGKDRFVTACMKINP